MNYVNAVGNVLRASAPSTSWLGSNAPGPATVIGTNANENLTGRNGDTVRGGGGDDVYGMAGNAIVIEEANQGIDTVNTWTSYRLPANVENLTMNGSWGWFGIGNELDNIITGSSGYQQIDGGAGNDVLIGGAGNDLFVVTAGNGSDLIVDFKPGGDQIKLGGYGLHTIDDIRAISVQRGTDTVLNFSNGEILVLSNVTASALSSSDFLLDVDRSRLTLTFSDEFDSLSLASGGGFWRTSYGYMPSTNIGSRYMHDEDQVYMDPSFAGTGTRALGVNPFSINDGVLTITAAPVTPDIAPYLGGQTYTSGLLTTQNGFSQLYGYFEIRAALPAGQGMWPAFWLLPSNGGWPPEIDVFEGLGADPTTLYYGSHQTQNGQKVSIGGRYHVDTTQFHTYGVDWTPQKLTFYIDGIAVHQQATPATMNTSMYMLLNLAVGGSWGGAPDATTGTGRMQVDYVRAYANEHTVVTAAPTFIDSSLGKNGGAQIFRQPTESKANGAPQTSPIGEDPQDVDAGVDTTPPPATNELLTTPHADDFIWVGDLATDMAVFTGRPDDIAALDFASDAVAGADMFGMDPDLTFILDLAHLLQQRPDLTPMAHDVGQSQDWWL